MNYGKGCSSFFCPFQKVVISTVMFSLVSAEMQYLENDFLIRTNPQYHPLKTVSVCFGESKTFYESGSRHKIIPTIFGNSYNRIIRFVMLTIPA